VGKRQRPHSESSRHTPAEALSMNDTQMSENDAVKSVAATEPETMESNGTTLYKCQVCGAWVPRLSYVKTAGIYACFGQRT
jgi:hypothetical protein